MSSIDAVGSNFLELEWKFRKYFIGQNVQSNRVLPNPELFKSSVDVFSIHDWFTRLPRRLKSWLYQGLLEKIIMP